MGEFKLWWPLGRDAEHDIDWGVLARVSAEIGAVCGMTAISMLLDVSSLEVARQNPPTSTRSSAPTGFANMLAALLGGVAAICRSTAAFC